MAIKLSLFKKNLVRIAIDIKNIACCIDMNVYRKRKRNLTDNIYIIRIYLYFISLLILAPALRRDFFLNKQLYSSPL